MGLADGAAYELEFGALHDAEMRQRGLNMDGSPRRETVQADQWDEKTRGKKMSDATGRVIFKYQMPVMEQFTMMLPKGAAILRVQDQGGMFWMWAMVRTDVPDVERKFRAFKCGGKIPDDLNLRYVGFCAVFVQQELGLYIFEEI